MRLHAGQITRFNGARSETICLAAIMHPLPKSRSVSQPWHHAPPECLRLGSSMAQQCGKAFHIWHVQIVDLRPPFSKRAQILARGPRNPLELATWFGP
jgi:hypothetical protein